MKELMRILFAIFRYPAAIVVAFVASIATISYLPDLFPAWTESTNSPFWDLIWFGCTGLAGVAAGSVCLPRKHQWIGSLSLLVLGLSFTGFVYFMFSEDNDSVISKLLLLVPLGAGGIIPVVIHYLLRPKSDSKQNGKETPGFTPSTDKPN